MKNKQIFWGSFFIFLGGLYMLKDYELLNFSFDAVLRYWPVILILAGIGIIFKNQYVKASISGISGLLAAILILGVIDGVGCQSRNYSYEYNDSDSLDSSSRSYSAYYDSAIVKAKLSIGSGASKIKIEGTSEELLFARSSGKLSSYEFTQTMQDSLAILQFEMKDTSISNIHGDFSNKLNIALSSKPLWDIDLSMGAVKADLDFSSHRIENISLESGASQIRLKLPKPEASTKVNIEMGAASIEIQIPKETGCKISGDMVMTIKDIDGFTKQGDGNYVNKFYSKTGSNVNIEIDAGISKFRITEY